MGSRIDCTLALALNRCFIRLVASSRLNYLSQLRTRLDWMGGAKIQLKIFCKASVHAHAAIKQLKNSTTNNRKEITCMETPTVEKTQQETMQQPILVPPGGGEKLNIAGSPISHKVKSKDTNGVFSVMKFVTPQG